MTSRIAYLQDRMQRFLWMRRVNGPLPDVLHELWREELIELEKLLEADHTWRQ